MLLTTATQMTAFSVISPFIDNPRPTLNGVSLLWKSKADSRHLSATSHQQDSEQSIDKVFDSFSSFLQDKQSQIIQEIESIDGSGEKFTRDTWGIFETTSSLSTDSNAPSDPSKSSSVVTDKRSSGGITRVFQRGDVVEKGACSFTLLCGGKLTSERASSIQGRQENSIIREGDEYAAAALSIVMHTRSPMVPTFRSDVRIFLVQPSGKRHGEKDVLAWFGGGADLTPYYLFDDDISFFHGMYQDLCMEHSSKTKGLIDFKTMKKACDKYFYLPARSEHRGTGGIFFDDMPATPETLSFVQDVADTWMPSWLPIIEKRGIMSFSEQQKQWQLLRRGRYLEFNLLYDRGVKFGLANATPRVEGVMVSAPPLIAWEYNHAVEEGSEEERLMKILKKPVDWVNAST